MSYVTSTVAKDGSNYPICNLRVEENIKIAKLNNGVLTVCVLDTIPKIAR